MAKTPPPDCKCKCDKCGKEASAPPGKYHRHCKGAKTKADKGTWVPR